MIGSEKLLERIFEEANDNFLKNNHLLLKTRVSERTLCGALMIELYEKLKKTKYWEYFVDVEYNRNHGGKLKTIKRDDYQIVKINCDLIVHSRGQNAYRDNLIAIEMKKSSVKEKYKDSDRCRLECLTKRPDQDVWSYGGEALPEHVCGYGLGVYYEVNYGKKNILVEYYNKGQCYHSYNIKIEKYL